MTAPIRIAQLSDTHFLEDGALPEGGHAYDVDAAFDAVLSDLGGASDFEMVVVTGDVADHGRVAQYRKAADAFSRFDAPVNVCPGNHDFDAPFTAGIGRSSVSTSRVVEIGSWAFVFVDSSAGVMNVDDSGLATDPPGGERLWSNGHLGPRESASLRRICDELEAEHIFFWLHHPPAPTVPMSHDEDYADEWRALLAELPRVRGLGGGHTHIPDNYEFEGLPVFVAPSLKNNFSLQDKTWLPPGYRSYSFASDGSVASDVHLVDGDAWPRRPFGRALTSLFMGEISHAELAEIIARRAADPSR